MTKDFSRLTRPHYPLPSFVKDALLSRGLLDAYHSRPAYQQNDYIGWITRAKHKETQEKRLKQMLEELEAGDRYMGMAYTENNRLPDYPAAASLHSPFHLFANLCGSTP